MYQDGAITKETAKSISSYKYDYGSPTCVLLPTSIECDSLMGFYRYFYKFYFFPEKVWYINDCKN